MRLQGRSLEGQKDIWLKGCDLVAMNQRKPSANNEYAPPCRISGEAHGAAAFGLFGPQSWLIA